MAGALKKRHPESEEEKRKEAPSCVPAILVPTGEAYIPLSVEEGRVAYDALKEFFDDGADGD